MERSCCHNESIRFTHSVHTRTRTHRHTKTVIDWNTKETHTSMEHSSSLHECMEKHKKEFWAGKIDVQAIFIAWCAEISTLSRSTFMGHNEYGMQAKMWLSFAFIHRMLSFFFFPFFPNQISFLCLFLAVLFSTVLQIRCRFFYCSRCLLTLHKLCFIWQTQAHEVLLHSVSVLDTRYTLKMFLHLRTYSFFLPWLFSLSSSFSISYWNNKIQRRRKNCILSASVAVCITIYNFFIIFQYYHTFYGLFKV